MPSGRPACLYLFQGDPVKIFITGYNKQQTDPSMTGTTASLMRAALVKSGHFVHQGPPGDYYADAYDQVFVGISSPLAATSRHSLAALLLLSRIAKSGPGLALFIDDPDIKKIGSGHRRAAREPDSLTSDFLIRNRPRPDVESTLDNIQDIVFVSMMLTEPPAQFPTIIPRMALAHGQPPHHLFPSGMRKIVPVDFTQVLFHPDAIVDMGVQAQARGELNKKRTDLWIAQGYTVSRAKHPWISQTLSNIEFPTSPAVDIRPDVITAFCQSVCAAGVLDQPPGTIVGWWSPWLPVSVAAGSFYATTAPVSTELGPSFGVIPAQFEAFDPDERAGVLAQQRTELRTSTAEWDVERVADVLLRAPQVALLDAQ